MLLKLLVGHKLNWLLNGCFWSFRLLVEDMKLLSLLLEKMVLVMEKPDQLLPTQQQKGRIPVGLPLQGCPLHAYPLLFFYGL